MNKVVVTGAKVEYILSGSATVDLNAHPQLVTDGADVFTIGYDAGRTIVSATIASGTEPPDIIWDGSSIQSSPGALARRAAAAVAQTAATASIIAASYAATLRRQADALNAHGKSYDAVRLLLKAQGIQS